MLKWLILLVFSMVSLAAHAQQRNLNVGATSGGSRVALVIGNDAYTRVPALRNARADAQAMATALRTTGFDVILRTDLDDRSLRSAVREFIARLSGGSEAVFYFAGHGVQLGAANYLLPTNINADNEAQVRDDGLPLQRVLDDLTDSKARFSVAIIDACRDNPFPRVAGRSIGTTRGLAPTSPATGQMVLFSAGTGQSALDRLGPTDRDPNGLFTRVLLKQIQQPGVPVDQVLRNVREEVVALAKRVGHEQVPALYDQTIGRFYFRPGTAVASAAPSAAATAVDPTANDRTFWESVKDSGNVEEIKAYLEQFPQGQFSALARTRLRALEASAPVPAPVVPAPSVASAAPSSQPAAMVAPPDPRRALSKLALKVSEDMDSRGVVLGRCTYARKQSTVLAGSIRNQITRAFPEAVWVSEAEAETVIDVTPMRADFVQAGNESTWGLEFRVQAMVRRKTGNLVTRSLSGRSVYTYPRGFGCSTWDNDVTSQLGIVADEVAANFLPLLLEAAR